jgi:hypothetical protein
MTLAVPAATDSSPSRAALSSMSESPMGERERRRNRSGNGHQRWDPRARPMTIPEGPYGHLRSPRQGGLRTASPSSSLCAGHRRHARTTRGRSCSAIGPSASRYHSPVYSGSIPPCWMPAYRPGGGGLRRPIDLEVPMAHLWHTRVRNPGQQDQPASSNQAQKRRIVSVPCGFRSHS